MGGRSPMEKKKQRKIKYIYIFGEKKKQSDFSKVSASQMSNIYLNAGTLSPVW